LKAETSLVTVVCLCYNQAAFVQEAINSVLNQTYPHIQLIVVDDGSTDNSAEVIQAHLANHTEVLFLNLQENLGNCRAFNRALPFVKGTYLIDLAADDILLPERIQKQVAAFDRLGEEYAVIFSDASYIDAQSRITGHHYSRNLQGQLLKPVPQGDVYTALLGPFYLLSCTTIYRTSVIMALGGYDEQLSYEDFDILTRMARHYKFGYLDEVLTLKRKTKGSLSTFFYKQRKNELLESTLRICYKIKAMNKNRDEDRALAFTVKYHMRQAYFTENFTLAKEYGQLLRELTPLDKVSRGILLLASLRIPTGFIYQRIVKRRGQ
jgi:glycosyltransferase involved in cell wall biosynthesis